MCLRTRERSELALGLCLRTMEGRKEGNKDWDCAYGLRNEGNKHWNVPKDIIITILLWVLSIYPFIKHYTIVILC